MQAGGRGGDWTKQGYNPYNRNWRTISGRLKTVCFLVHTVHTYIHIYPNPSVLSPVRVCSCDIEYDGNRPAALGDTTTRRAVLADWEDVGL